MKKSYEETREIYSTRRIRYGSKAGVKRLLRADMAHRKPQAKGRMINPSIL